MAYTDSGKLFGVSRKVVANHKPFFLSGVCPWFSLKFSNKAIKDCHRKNIFLTECPNGLSELFERVPIGRILKNM